MVNRLFKILLLALLASGCAGLRPKPEPEPPIKILAVTMVDENNGGAGSGDPQTMTGTLGDNFYTFVGSATLVNTQTIVGVSGGGLTWTLSSPVTNSTCRTYWFWAQGTPNANPFDIVFDLSTSTALAVTITVYSGVDTGDPFSNETSATGSSTTPAVTISTTGFDAGDLYWNGIGFRVSGNTFTADPDWLERVEKNTAASNSAIADEDGSDNSPVHTLSSSGAWVVFGMVINQAAGTTITRRKVIFQ